MIRDLHLTLLTPHVIPCFHLISLCGNHCVKNVQIRRYSGPYFPAFGLNTERYGVFLRIQSECGKMRTKITLNTDIFHAGNFVETCSFLWFLTTLWKTMLFQKVSTTGNQIKIQFFIPCYIHEFYQERNLLELKMETVPCSVRDTVCSMWKMR